MNVNQFRFSWETAKLFLFLSHANIGMELVKRINLGWIESDWFLVLDLIIDNICTTVDRYLLSGVAVVRVNLLANILHF